MLQWLLDLIFPKHCLGCGRAGSYICEACQARLIPADPVEPLDVSEIWAAYDYNDPIIRQAVWQLKYRGITSLAQELAGALSERLLEELTEWKLFAGTQPIVVVPIPLSPARSRARGYNQAALIAKAICERFPDWLQYEPNWLQKIKDTPAQVSLKNRAARLANLRGAFKIAPGGEPAGRTILIIDDVVTTGATLAEASKVLKAGGAERILGAALAHRN